MILGMRRVKIMFDIALTFMSRLIDLLPSLISIYILFDFMGSLLFGRR